MKKVAIITMISNNYGNRLQNYALQEYLNKIGVNSETIYNAFYNPIKRKLNIFNFPLKVINRIKLLYLGKKYKNIEESRNKSFKEFNEKYINFAAQSIKTEDDIANIRNLYNKFIVGSDQVWNPHANRNKLLDFLSFSPKEKNITYAVSFGVEKLDSCFYDEYKKGMENFSHISVREYEGKRIIQELTSREDIELLIDPTMLLTREEWQSIEKKPNNYDKLKGKKYILSYFLGNLSTKRAQEINKIAKENDCEIIEILNKDSDFYTCSPSEFLYLERNAFLICTDSFHSCVFGILFKTPFIVYKREDDITSMFSRINNLLCKFNLETRCYNGEIANNLLSCEYSDTDNILQEERKKAKCCIEKALEIEENK